MTLWWFMFPVHVLKCLSKKDFSTYGLRKVISWIEIFRFEQTPNSKEGFGVLKKTVLNFHPVHLHIMVKCKEVTKIKRNNLRLCSFFEIEMPLWRRWLQSFRFILVYFDYTMYAWRGHFGSYKPGKLRGNWCKGQNSAVK